MARTGIFGRSGVGKSWFFGKYLEDTIPQFTYAVHFDKEDEEIGLSREGDSLLKTFYIGKEEYHEEVEYQGRRMPLVTAVILENKKVRIVPEDLTPEENRELMAQVSDLAMRVGETDATFHVSADEAHEFIPEVGDDLDERTVRMLTGGRKKGVEYAFCTQRPAKMHEDAFTQLNHGIYFELSKDNDVAKVNNSCGFNAYTMLDGLGTRTCLVENLDTGDLKEVSTEDLERTRPHYADDDGIADEVINSFGGEDKTEAMGSASR